MYGSIAGSVCGSRFGAPEETLGGDHLFSDSSYLEFNGLMTVAMADAIMNYYDPGCEGFGKGTPDLSRRIDELHLRNRVDTGIRKWQYKFPDAKHICHETNMAAAMISPAAWLFEDIEAVRKAAIICADTCFRYEDKRFGHESVMRDIRGAEAIASAVYLARTGLMKEDIAKYLTEEFGYDFDSIDSIDPIYSIASIHSSGIDSPENAGESGGYMADYGGVPEALAAFFRGRDPEEIIRLAVIYGNYGPSSSAIAAMAGGIAAAYYGADWAVISEGCRKLPDEVLAVIQRFEKSKYDRNPQDEVSFSISFARRRMMVGEDKEVAAFYRQARSISKTAESFGMTPEEVNAILYKARIYVPEVENVPEEGKDVISYVNELSPVKLKRGKGRKIRIACGTGFKEYEQLVLHILMISDVDPSGPELGQMTGLLPFELKNTIHKIYFRAAMRKNTLQYLEVISEREEDEK